MEFIEKALELNLVICVASSGTPEKINFNLSESGLKGYFKTIISCEDIKRGKPEPDIFLASARRLGVKPGNCIVVEDSLYGITAAKRASMYCIGLTTSFSRERLIEADMIVDNLTEVPLEEFYKISVI